jgi:hypothetical protein
VAKPVKRAAPIRRTAALPKGGIKPLILKARGGRGGAGSSDQDIIAATIADSSAGRTTNREQEWYCYERHPWVRACVRLIANSVSQESFTVAAIEGETASPLTPDDDPRVKEIHEFFRTAFSGKSLRSALVTLVTDIEVFGLGYWERRKQGNLIWFERQDPRTMTPVLNAEKTEIASYIVKRPQQMGGSGMMMIDSAAPARTISADDVIHFAFEGGDAVFGAPSLLESLDLTVAMDLSIRLHRNAYFRNGATHGTYVLLPEASEEQAQEFEKKMFGLKVGASKAYSPIIIAGQQADVKQFATAGKNEIDFIKGSELSRDEIAAVFSVPVGKLLFSGGALGSAGKAEDDETFQRDCVLPLEEMIYETLTQEVLVKEFEIDDLALIPRRRAQVRLDRFLSATTLVKFGGTGNEARDLVGLPKVDDEKMDLPLFIGNQGGTVPEPPGALMAQEAQFAPTAGGQSGNPAGQNGKPSQSGQVEGSNDQQASDAKKKHEVATKKAATSPFIASESHWTPRTARPSISTNGHSRQNL